MTDSSHINPVRRLARKLYSFVTPTSFADVERAEWTEYVTLLREGMIVFDVGANIGELSLLFSRFVRSSGQVHAFEPVRETFDRLQSIITAAGRSNVRLNQLAVSDENGAVDMNVYSAEYSSWNTIANRPLASLGVEIQPPTLQKVASITVDQYCADNNIDYIDLLKIDVEGAEYQVLRGAKRMLQNRRIACCIFEFGQTTIDMGNSPKMISDYLGEMNYGIRNVVRHDPVFPLAPRTKAPCFSLMVSKPQ